MSKISGQFLISGISGQLGALLFLRFQFRFCSVLISSPLFVIQFIVKQW